jgi:hypothetical protein
MMADELNATQIQQVFSMQAITVAAMTIVKDVARGGFAVDLVSQVPEKRCIDIISFWSECVMLWE